MELNEAILHRRSVREFTDYDVTDDEIGKILEAARWAPSWANTQVWEFVVVRDKNLIKEVTETYSETNPARSCSFKASVILVACARQNISGCKNGVERTKFENWFLFDVGMTVQNISLKAHELGLGSVIVGSLDHNKLNSLLNVPDGIEAVVAIPIGKPTKKIAPTSRKKSEECVRLNKF